MIKAKMYLIKNDYRCILQFNTQSWAIPIFIHWIDHNDEDDITIQILIFRVNIFKFMK